MRMIENYLNLINILSNFRQFIELNLFLLNFTGGFRKTSKTVARPEF
jgi:hypothetical protein